MSRPNAGREAMAIPVEGAGAELVSLEAVGNYALLPVWADGHRFGIYAWGYLRSLCPCGEHGP